jgi:monoamine oxidase
LAEVSTVDLSRSAERDNAVFCRQGLGALLAKLAPAAVVQLAAPVSRVSWGRGNVEVETSKGQFRAAALIVTVSTNVLASGKIKFSPELPKRQLDAAAKLRLGSRDRVALQFAGNALGLRADELVFEKSESRQTAAIFANASGSTLCTVDVGGSFGRDVSAKGEAAMIDFAIEWISGLYGPEVKSSVKRRHAMRWNNEPWVLGAASAAVPGGQSARKVLTEPLAGRVFFAGEAVHETLWGTVGGAWDSGERAADAVVKMFGGGARGR